MQLIAVLLFLAYPRPAPQAPTVPVVVGHSVTPLNGPWRFHTGDDAHWADPDFDDSGWEIVDLTPAAGAHDPDVGLPGYVAGWGARGHAAYSGYGWYRLRLSVTAPPGDTLAIAAPLEVDDAYEMFIDGQRMGGSGDFAQSTPIAYNTRPLMFTLRRAPTVVAVRVWVAPSTMHDDPSAGGIRIAPALGEESAIAARYQLEWLKKITGYVIDAVEPMAFILLAMIAIVLTAFESTDGRYRWVAAALVLLALRRVNQAVFYWTPYESAPTVNFITNVLLTPLVLGTWTMAWRRWFKLDAPRWAAAAIGSLTILYVVVQATDQAVVATIIRVGFLVLYVLTLFQAVRRRPRDLWLSMLAAISLAVGLFADELSLAHIPGIWFPFGTGVSRTQYAYAAFIVLLAALLLRRLLSFAGRTPGRWTLDAGR